MVVRAIPRGQLCGMCRIRTNAAQLGVSWPNVGPVERGEENAGQHLVSAINCHLARCDVLVVLEWVISRQAQVNRQRSYAQGADDTA